MSPRAAAGRRISVGLVAYAAAARERLAALDADEPEGARATPA
jgi:hypothetical protein